MLTKGLWSHCPHCGNTKNGANLYRCKSCSGVYCSGCMGFSTKCPHCGDFRFFGPDTLGKINPRRGGPPLMDPRPKIASAPTAAASPGGTAAGSRQEPVADPAQRGGEEIDWPRWEAAPPEAPAISHEQKLSGYTRENGLKAVQRANVDPDRAARTAHARHLIRYCEHVLGGRARGFIACAASDTGLPENVRRLYIHAARIVTRTQETSS